VLTGIVSTTNEVLKGSHLQPEPLTASLPGVKLDTRLLRKPPDLEELKRHSVNAVNIGMSRACSPGLKMAITLFNSSLPYPRSLRKLRDTTAVRRRAGDVDSISMCNREAEGSRLEPLPASRCRPWLSRLDR
jgi:hypothetical protein